MRIGRLLAVFVFLWVLSSCGLGGDALENSMNEDFLTTKQAVQGLKAPVHKKKLREKRNTFKEPKELSQEEAQKQVAANKEAIKQAERKEEARKQAEAEREAQKQAEEKRAAKQREEEKEKAQQAKAKQPSQKVSNQGVNKATKTEQPKKKTKNKATAEEDAFSKEIIRLTNEERQKHGLQKLNIHNTLTTAAYEKSRDMAVNDYFSHISPTYGSPFDMISQWGINYSMAGENIASGHTDAQQLVSDWMGSEPHREAILKPEFTHIGVGVYSDGNYFTQLFIQSR